MLLPKFYDVWTAHRLLTMRSPSWRFTCARNMYRILAGILFNCLFPVQSWCQSQSHPTDDRWCVPVVYVGTIMAGLTGALVWAVRGRIEDMKEAMAQQTKVQERLVESQARITSSVERIDSAVSGMLTTRVPK